MSTVNIYDPLSVSDEQIARMEVVIHDMAKRGNFAAIGLSKELMPLASMQNKRRIILGAYAHFYELMVCLNMALSSTADVDEMMRKLEGLPK